MKLLLAVQIPHSRRPKARSEKVRRRLDHRKVEAREVCRRIEVLTKVILTFKLSSHYKRKRDDSRKDAKHAKFGKSEDTLNFAPWRLGAINVLGFVMREPGLRKLHPSYGAVLP